MPAPKTPNTAAATAAVRRRGQETMAAKLREAGWLVVPPEKLTDAITTAYESAGVPVDDGTTALDLRAIARRVGIAGAARMTKRELVHYLNTRLT